jgi:sec-independent protein translocase protein TatB
MFDLFSWSHILILLTVALVVVGPKDLPRLMNIAGRWAGKARNMANEFKKSFEDMARQSELDELRAEVERLKTHDPMADLNNDIQRALNPVDTEAAEARAAAEAERQETPAPRSGEYQISETPPGEQHPETAQP